MAFPWYTGGKIRIKKNYAAYSGGVHVRAGIIGAGA